MDIESSERYHWYFEKVRSKTVVLEDAYKVLIQVLEDMISDLKEINSRYEAVNGH